MYFKTSLAVNYNRCLLSDILKLIKIGIFVCFLRIRLYITKTDNHWFNIFAHISKTFQWFIMKSCLRLSYNIVSKLEYPSFFLPSTCLFPPFSLSFHSFMPFFWGEDWRITWHCRWVFTRLHLYCARLWNSVPYQVTFSVARLVPHATFFFTF